MSTASYTMRRNQNLYRAQAKVELGPISVGIVTIGMVSVLALLYLTQITKTTVYGSRLNELTNKHEKVSRAKQELEVEGARLSALKNIQSAKVVSGLVPEQNVSYATK